MGEEKSVLHVDMDAFFASVERARKGLEGPIVICVYSGRSEDSGAVSTCSYDARELGIHAAMPITRAKNIADNSDKEVHFLSMDREYYREVSNGIREKILEKYSDKIEQASIDEAYLEFDENVENAIEIARDIQEEVKEEFDITCSIGIAPNKLVAKIASDRDKPEGLTAVREDEIKEFMFGLELGEIHGIGDKTVEKLEDIGIENVKELAEAETSILVREFGENLGIKLKEKAQGIDNSEVTNQEQKQITRITTLAENSSRASYIEKYFPDLAEEIMENAEGKNIGFRKVSLILIDSEIEMHTRTTTLKSYVQDREIINQEAENLLESFLKDFDGKVRRIGIRIKDLRDVGSRSSLDKF